MNYRLFIFLLNVSVQCYSQDDTINKAGTIKIVKASDSIYIKAFAEFKVFDPVYKKEVNQNAIEKAFDKMRTTTNSGYTNPTPTLSERLESYDYSTLFNQINRKEIKLGDKNSDTVEIRIDITYEGKVYCRDLKTQMRLIDGNIKYDTKLDEFKNTSFSTHLSSFNTIKSIEKWTPAKAMVRKGITWGNMRTQRNSESKKLKLTNTNSSGIITIIFSKQEIVE